MTNDPLHIPLLPSTRGGFALYIKVYVCGNDGNPTRTTALIDTGATGVYISPKLAEKCKATIIPGQRIKMLFVHRTLQAQVAAVWLAVHKRVIDAEGVSIIRPWPNETSLFERKHDVIIGARWLQEHRAVLDLGRRTMTIRILAKEKP